MFSESEANALITVEQLVLKNKDNSLLKAYTEAVDKVKAVLRYTTREKAELLSQRITISPVTSKANTSNILMLIQNALTNYLALDITYRSEHKKETTQRMI